uniref:RNA-directed DNA polymerase, eukaryota n=1 Tax=Tanacetum cinerariifolium TaxID=118510 RepID=A0A699HEA4_TANCI|nr:RNA-directed DNA polymerase, eukaryota [Tanacetum cinerariifolium]
MEALHVVAEDAINVGLYHGVQKLLQNQADDLERVVSRDEIRLAVWNCGDNKSPGPDGYSFEFLKKYWDLIGSDLCEVLDAKFVSDFRPISLIGCVYKVITKVLANRLMEVISDLVSDTQSAFVSGRQILDGPFILDELLQWCKRRNKQTMFFKVDFAKAYDSIRWDYLIDVLGSFGFGPVWCNWIRGSLTSAKASILVNGSPTNEFSLHCGLKQGDPLAPYLFILVMESLHLSICHLVDNGLFSGIQLPGSVTISHLFYADDAMFIGEWSEENLKVILNALKCFFLASGVTIGDRMTRIKAWENVIVKLRSRLSKWKVKTLSIGGRLTLLKSVLGASPIYSMSIFKVPYGVLKIMEAIRSMFFNGIGQDDSKITWIAWNKVLASKKRGGLGVSSFFALNRALLLKWVWRFISQDGSLWSCVIRAIYGPKIDAHKTHTSSNWCAIVGELYSLKDKGFDFWSHCKKRIGNGLDTSFWYDCWIDDSALHIKFPRLFALELDKDISVAGKMNSQIGGIVTCLEMVNFGLRSCGIS